MTRLVLASASIVRARLLKSAGVEFEIVPARTDEEAVKQLMLAKDATPWAIADALAELKALRISATRPDDLVLGADQVLEFDGKPVSKAANMGEARTLLSHLRGQKHELISALVLAKDGSPVWRHVEKAALWMRRFSDEFLDDYLGREGEAILGGVGCYRLEGLGAQLFERIEGDYFAVLGLPLAPLLSALREQSVIAQ